MSKNSIKSSISARREEKALVKGQSPRPQELEVSRGGQKDKLLEIAKCRLNGITGQFSEYLTRFVLNKTAVLASSLSSVFNKIIMNKRGLVCTVKNK